MYIFQFLATEYTCLLNKIWARSPNTLYSLRAARATQHLYSIIYALTSTRHLQRSSRDSTSTSSTQLKVAQSGILLGWISTPDTMTLSRTFLRNGMRLVSWCWILMSSACCTPSTVPLGWYRLWLWYRRNPWPRERKSLHISRQSTLQSHRQAKGCGALLAHVQGTYQLNSRWWREFQAATWTLSAPRLSSRSEWHASSHLGLFVSTCTSRRVGVLSQWSVSEQG